MLDWRWHIFSKPINYVAGNATLKFLQQNRANVYDQINRMGEECRREIDRAFHDRGVGSLTTGVGSLLLTHFLKAGQKGIRSSKDAYDADEQMRFQFYFGLLAKHSVFFLPGNSGAISYAHTDEDIKHFIDSVDSLAEEAKSISKIVC